jgi:two-component system, chemotaxis family, protein-glutamate methylesterase/glutaminase
MDRHGGQGPPRDDEKSGLSHCALVLGRALALLLSIFEPRQDDMIKVLVVDDSALMRKHLVTLLESEGDFQIRVARNGVEALSLLNSFDPDVITLDINMPEMDGITCLSRIMVERPKPVLMVSSLTEKGAEATLQAMSLGAVDYVHKPDGTISLSIERVQRELLVKVRAAATAKVRRTVGLRDRLIQDRSRAQRPDRRLFGPAPGQFGLVLMGVSTGGPGILEEILPALPADFPWAVLVAQHMPGSFTSVFAKRMDSICAMQVQEVSHQTPIEPGRIYVAKGDADLVVLGRNTAWLATPVPSSQQHLWHPSVERLVASATEAMPAERLIGVLLTGMGDDGAAAMADLKRKGGRTIAQDESTCIVFGMPSELIRRGGADLVLPSGRIARQLAAWTSPAAFSNRSRAHGAG